MDVCCGMCKSEDNLACGSDFPPCFETGSLWLLYMPVYLALESSEILLSPPRISSQHSIYRCARHGIQLYIGLGSLNSGPHTYNCFAHCFILPPPHVQKFHPFKVLYWSSFSITNLNDRHRLSFVAFRSMAQLRLSQDDQDWVQIGLKAFPSATSRNGAKGAADAWFSEGWAAGEAGSRYTWRQLKVLLGTFCHSEAKKPSSQWFGFCQFRIGHIFASGVWSNEQTFTESKHKCSSSARQGLDRH